jgi:serine protease Do
MKDFLGKRFGFISVVSVGLISLVIGIMLSARLDITTQTSAEDLWEEGRPTLVSATPSLRPGSFAELAKQADPAVVNISTTQVVKQPHMDPQFRSPFEDFFGDEFFDKFFGDGRKREFRTQSLGSGFVINKEGFIITNNHVIENAEEIIVKLSSGKEYEAEIIGTDSRTDLALVKIEADAELPIIPLADSDDIQIGDWVVAIGNPFGLSHTVTAGIVSAKGRVIGMGPYDNFIQTDASINPGNSGGPLLNIKGEVVGINTAIIASGQGIGFAIPINMAKNIILQLKQKGKVTRGWLGVGIQEVTNELAQSFGLDEKTGALISSVREGDPASKYGIEVGDIIIEFDGKEIKEYKDLPRVVSNTVPGEKVSVKILRNGKEKTLKVVVGEMKEEELAKEEKTGEKKRFGLRVQDITPNLSRQFGLEDVEGAIVVSVAPGSSADKAGIRPKDMIRKVNGSVIGNFEDYEGAIKKIKKGDVVRFLLERNGSSLFVAIKAED